MGINLEKIFRVLNTPVSIADPSLPDCPLVDVNDAFCDMTGYHRDDIIGRNCKFLQGADTLQSSCQAIRESINHQEPLSICLHNYKKDRTPFHNLLFMMPIKSSEGHPLVMGCQREISEKEWLEDVNNSITEMGNLLKLDELHKAFHVHHMFSLQARSIIAHTKAHLLMEASNRAMRAVPEL